MKLKAGLGKDKKKIDKHLARLIKEKREQAQVNKIRNELTADSKEVQRIVRDYYKQLYANIMDNLERNIQILKKVKLPRWNQEEIENMNISVTSTEIEIVI